MPAKAILVECKNKVAYVTFNRPDALNCLNGEMLALLPPIISDLKNDRDIRTVVLRGAGNHFMAGADLRFLLDLIKGQAPGVRSTRIAKVIDSFHEVIKTLRSMPQPVIAEVRGVAAGGGLSLMLACDLVLAADDSRFTAAYLGIGTSPDGSLTFTLPRVLGTKLAMELLVTGRTLQAKDAKALGLINDIVPAGLLPERTAEVAELLAAGPGLAIARTKGLLDASSGQDLAAQLLRERENFSASAATKDFEEGIRAFLEKRRAEFQGC